ncbi:Zinc finger CCCH domain-containing protein 3 [Vanrija pseudolonga]|uniref:Zinc finger CCCH domain-containing protein 3 n=1 Tax=Vanrija pseudolonga TaxID=143232 RepID=A0AAF1BHE3_9TREE|nr:Zinc finger CCCH domain-containing protein 3 [Vanrija pseudolonga]
MPPMSAAERQKLLLQQEIAKLSGAITSYSQSSSSSHHHQSSYHPYRGYPSRGSSYRGAPRGRGGRGRGGRGRGGSYSLDLRGNNASGSSTPVDRPTTGPSEREEGEVTPPVEDAAPKPAAESSNWVKKTSKGGNMSLMTVDKSNKLSSRPRPPRPPKVPAHIQVLQSSTDSSPGGTQGKRVVIDGVIFEFAEDGQKLVRLQELEPKKNATSTPTRQSLKYAGEQYRRTKRGDLVSRSTLAARRAEQAKKPCRYWTKTGRCERALTCPYKHTPGRIAICPAFMYDKCDRGNNCPLSHTPSAHNAPSCARFQATSTCYKGDKCKFPHVRVADDAPVCEAFAREGWCDEEAGTCPELHIWECPEFHDKGTCSRGARCGLRHILRAEKAKKTAAAVAAAAPAAARPTSSGAAPAAFDDQSEFIGFPGEVFSETDEDEDDEDDEEDEEDSDEEAGDDSDEEMDEDESVEEDSGKPQDPSSPSAIDTDDDDELQVLGAV